jgi:hypothetical protein
MAAKLFNNFTLSNALAFVQDMSRNPLTGRTIKLGSSTYQKLVALSSKLLPDNEILQSLRMRRTHTYSRGCRKWLKAEACSADYGYSPMVLCPCGSRSNLYLIHDSCGDYICSYCDETVSLAYFCVVCKGQREPEEHEGHES